METVNQYTNKNCPNFNEKGSKVYSGNDLTPTSEIHQDNNETPANTGNTVYGDVHQVYDKISSKFTPSDETKQKFNDKLEGISSSLTHKNEPDPESHEHESDVNIKSNIQGAIGTANSKSHSTLDTAKDETNKIMERNNTDETLNDTGNTIYDNVHRIYDKISSTFIPSDETEQKLNEKYKGISSNITHNNEYDSELHERKNDNDVKLNLRDTIGAANSKANSAFETTKDESNKAIEGNNFGSGIMDTLRHPIEAAKKLVDTKSDNDEYIYNKNGRDNSNKIHGNIDEVTEKAVGYGKTAKKDINEAVGAGGKPVDENDNRFQNEKTTIPSKIVGTTKENIGRAMGNKTIEEEGKIMRNKEENA